MYSPIVRCYKSPRSSSWRFRRNVVCCLFLAVTAKAEVSASRARSLELVAVGEEAQSRDVTERPCGFVRVYDRGERGPYVVWAGRGGGAVQGAGGCRESTVSKALALFVRKARFWARCAVAPDSPMTQVLTGRDAVR